MAQHFFKVQQLVPVSLFRNKNILEVNTQRGESTMGEKEGQMFHKDGEEPIERSPGGSPMLRHGERQLPFKTAQGDPEHIQAISNHIEKYLGPVHTVLHEIVSDLVHIDVHVVEPTDERPWLTLVTSGMSAAPMRVPSETGEEMHWAELMISLPPDWALSPQAFEDEANYWPIRSLKMLARLPHAHDTWLGLGHTVPNGDPPEPLAEGTDFIGFMVYPSVTAPEDFWLLELTPNKAVAFYAIYPLYLEEMALKLEWGLDPLLERLGEGQVTDLVDTSRVNVALESLDLGEVSPENAIRLFQSGRFEEALSYAEAMLEASPEVALSWRFKGECLGELQRFQEAEECLVRAVALGGPGTEDLPNHIALMQFCYGNVAGAVKTLNQNIEKSSDPEIVAQARMMLEEFQG